MAGPKTPKDTAPQEAFLAAARKEVEGSPFKLMQVATPGDAPKIKKAFEKQLGGCLEDLHDKNECRVDVELDNGDKMNVSIKPNRVDIARTGDMPGKATIKLSAATQKTLNP